MNVGEVRTFPRENIPDLRTQALKILEEAAEVFAEAQIQDYDFDKLILECSDVIMATCNMLHSLGCGNVVHIMKACERRNEERGRYDIQG